MLDSDFVAPDESGIESNSTQPAQVESVKQTPSLNAEAQIEEKKESQPTEKPVENNQTGAFDSDFVLPDESEVMQPQVKPKPQAPVEDSDFVAPDESAIEQ